MPVINREDKNVKATAIYREGESIKITPESSYSAHTGFVQKGVKFIADHFPHVVGCKMTAYHTFDGNRSGVNITYYHPTATAFIQILIHPVESNKAVIMIRRAVEDLSETHDALSKTDYWSVTDACRDDHAATVTIGEGGAPFSCVVNRVGRELSESVRTSTPVLLDIPDDTAKDSDKVRVVLELDKIAKSLGDRLHEFYGHKIETKK